MKQFKTKNAEDSSTKRTEIYKILNITLENSIDAMKKPNIINKGIRVSNEIENEVARNTVESSNADDQIFEDIIIDNNLLNSKIQNVYTTFKFSTCCSNRLIIIESSLSSVERRMNITAFVTIEEVSIKKK